MAFSFRRPSQPDQFGFAPSSWARTQGLADLESRISRGVATPQDIAFMGQIASVGPEAGAQAMWNDFVARLQDRASGSVGIAGIEGLSTGIPLADNALSMLGLNSVGGMTGYNAATGGDIGQGVAMDAAGLAAGYGLAGMGLGTPASAAAGGTATGGGGAAAAGGGFAMPPAQALPPELLLDMGLLETAPGVWAAGGAGAATLPAAAPAGASMPPAVPEAGAAVSSAPAATTAAALPSFLTSPQVLGGAAGALLGSGILGGGTEAEKTTVEEGLPDWLLPYAKPALDRYTTELQNYQTDPYGVMPAAMQQFKDTVSGMYLDPATNKYLEDYFKLGAERIKTNLSPSFGHMQAFGQHSGYNEALSRGLGDFATGLYGGNYAKERDRQTTMTASAPSFLGQASTAQFAPYQQYLSTIGSLGRKKEEPYYTNPMGNILGGGMLGFGLGNAFK